MGILSWIIFGLVAGAIAKLINPGKDPGGWIVTIFIGNAGAFVGGFLGSLIGFGDITGFNIKSLILAVAGALLLLFLYARYKKRQGRTQLTDKCQGEFIYFKPNHNLSTYEKDHRYCSYHRGYLPRLQGRATLG